EQRRALRQAFDSRIQQIGEAGGESGIDPKSRLGHIAHDRAHFGSQGGVADGVPRSVGLERPRDRADQPGPLDSLPVLQTALDEREEPVLRVEGIGIAAWCALHDHNAAGGRAAAATGPAATTITKQMDKQAQELAFELPGALVQRLGGGIVVTLPESMMFAQESDELTAASRDNLRRLATSFEQYPNTRIMIV